MITRFHTPLASSPSAREAKGTIRTRHPSESRTCFKARWLTISSSTIRIPTSAKDPTPQWRVDQYRRWGFGWMLVGGPDFQGENLSWRAGEHKAKYFT